MSDTVKRLLEAREAARKSSEQQIENEAEYKAALNAVAATKDGAFVLKTLAAVCGHNRPVMGMDGVGLVDATAKRNLFLLAVRNYLEPANRRIVDE